MSFVSFMPFSPFFPSSFPSLISFCRSFILSSLTHMKTVSLILFFLMFCRSTLFFFFLNSWFPRYFFLFPFILSFLVPIRILSLSLLKSCLFPFYSPISFLFVFFKVDSLISLLFNPLQLLFCLAPSHRHTHRHTHTHARFATL